jgi:two-component system, NarL family, response regulator LiaR
MTTKNRVIQILIVDDHEIVRLGLATAFARYPDLNLIGEATNGQEAVDFCARLQPDFILMDLSMPVMDGITATRIICAAYPLIVVLVFTGSGDLDHIQKAVNAGAKGYMRKSALVAEVVVVIRSAFMNNN